MIPFMSVPSPSELISAITMMSGYYLFLRNVSRVLQSQVLLYKVPTSYNLGEVSSLLTLHTSTQ